MKFPLAKEILVENSVEILQLLSLLLVAIFERLTMDSNVPWEAFLLVVDQDIFHLLYYQ